jgi:hypothetical protein
MRYSLQNLLITSQRGLLKVIGIVDHTVATVQDGVQNSSFAVVLEGQKSAAKLYDLAPPAVNRWIQRVGTTRDNRVIQQANGIRNQFRDNGKKWFDAWFEHEHDVSTIQYLYPAFSFYLLRILQLTTEVQAVSLTGSCDMTL